MSKKGDRLRGTRQKNCGPTPTTSGSRNATEFRLNWPSWPKNWPISGTQSVPAEKNLALRALWDLLAGGRLWPIGGVGD